MVTIGEGAQGTSNIAWAATVASTSCKADIRVGVDVAVPAALFVKVASDEVASVPPHRADFATPAATVASAPRARAKPAVAAHSNARANAANMMTPPRAGVVFLIFL